MHKYLWALGFCFIMTYSCLQKEIKNFGLITNEFITEYARLFPDETPLSIDNLNLSNLHIPEDSILISVQNLVSSYSSTLKDYSYKELTPLEQKNYLKMQNILKSIQSYLHQYKYNPTYFNIAYGFQRILNSNYAPAEKRLQVIFNKLEKVPNYYAAAKKQLATSQVSLIHENTDKHLATYTFLKNTLPSYIIKHYHMTPQYQARINAAELAVKDYVAYVESLKLQ